jgi:hypothetical protein
MQKNKGVAKPLPYFNKPTVIAGLSKNGHSLENPANYILIKG